MGHSAGGKGGWVLAVAALWPSWGGAAPFSADSVVVYRVGTEAIAANGNATAVFLDEFSATGALLQSIALPTAPVGDLSPVTASGRSGVEGRLSLSADGSKLVVPGYSTSPGGTTAAANPIATPRVVAMVDANGAAVATQTVTTLSSRLYGAVSADGVGAYLFGASGIAYVDAAGQSTKLLSGTRFDVAIADGQLYYTDGASPGIYALGDGLPTAGSPAGRLVVGVVGNAPRGFTFADLSDTVAGMDTLYVSDFIESRSGISKYSKQANGEWVYRQTRDSGALDLTSRVVAGQVQIFGTNANALYVLTDTSGYDGDINGVTTTLVTAPRNIDYYGVAFAPTAVPEAASLNLALVGVLCCLGLRFTATTNSTPRARATGGSAPADAVRR